MSYSPVVTRDSSLTLFNDVFQEHYHSLKAGAYSEALYKHVLLPPTVRPSLLQKSKIKILDICFGLGYNTFVTLLEYAKLGFQGELEIFSPEMDEVLLQRLLELKYPDCFEVFRPILRELVSCGRARFDRASLHLHVGDAREYVRCLDSGFDVVYQDAFSPAKNPALWTLEYFQDLSRILDFSGIITTYTRASRVRFTAHLAGFYVYPVIHEKMRGGTIFTPLPRLDGFEAIDWEQKCKRSSQLNPLRDVDLS